MALASDLRLRRMRNSSDRRQAYGDAFAAQFDLRDNLRQNPASPDAWASLALAKYYTGESGPEFSKALQLAQEAGPWEITSQPVVIAVGLSSWAKLGPDDQAKLRGTLERAARRNPERVAQQARALQRLDVFCDLDYVRSLSLSSCSTSGRK
jgi:hypothetical protein